MAKTVTAKDFPDERAKRLVDREFNLSASASLPPANKIVAGDYCNANDRGVMSIEEGIATTLNLKLEDRVIRRRRRAGQCASPGCARWIGTVSASTFFALIIRGDACTFAEELHHGIPPAGARHADAGAIVNAARNVLAIDVSEMMARVRSIV